MRDEFATRAYFLLLREIRHVHPPVRDLVLSSQTRGLSHASSSGTHHFGGFLRVSLVCLLFKRLINTIHR